MAQPSNLHTGEYGGLNMFGQKHTFVILAAIQSRVHSNDAPIPSCISKYLVTHEIITLKLSFVQISLRSGLHGTNIWCSDFLIINIFEIYQAFNVWTAILIHYDIIHSIA